MEQFYFVLRRPPYLVRRLLCTEDDEICETPLSTKSDTDEFLCIQENWYWDDLIWIWIRSALSKEKIAFGEPSLDSIIDV